MSSTDDRLARLEERVDRLEQALARAMQVWLELRRVCFAMIGAVEALAGISPTNKELRERAKNR